MKPYPIQPGYASKQEQIEWLIAQRFPLRACDLQADLSKREFRRSMGEYSLREFSYRDELRALTDAEVAKRYRAAMSDVIDAALASAREVENDRARRGLLADADYKHWCRLPYWSADEAAALSLGRDPEIVNSMSLWPCRHEFEFARTYYRRLDHIRRAVRAKQLLDEPRPCDFIAWATANDMSLPAEFVALIQSNDAAKHPLGPSVPEPDKSAPGPLTTRETNTLLRVLCAVAIKHFRFDPHKELEGQRTHVTSCIRACFDEQGQSIDDGTIKKFLGLAAQAWTTKGAKPNSD